MIKLTDKNELEKAIELEQDLIDLIIASQIDLSKDLMSSIKIFTEDIFNEFIKYLNKIKENIELFNELKNKLVYLQKVKNKKKKRRIIADYNNFYSSSNIKILNSNEQIKEFIEKMQLDKKTADNEISTIEENTPQKYIENTLIISELSGTVILPYTIDELNKKLSEDSEFKNIDEIITAEYTIPIKFYKHSAISRFREGLNLALNRSNLSYLKALSLGLELLTNYNLHPAIITACNNIDELDIYLSCLEDNELDDFKLFDIKFEMLPQITKDKSLVQNN